MDVGKVCRKAPCAKRQNSNEKKKTDERERHTGKPVDGTRFKKTSMIQYVLFVDASSPLLDFIIRQVVHLSAYNAQDNTLAPLINRKEDLLAVPTQPPSRPRKESEGEMVHVLLACCSRK